VKNSIVSSHRHPDDLLLNIFNVRQIELSFFFLLTLSNLSFGSKMSFVRVNHGGIERIQSSVMSWLIGFELLFFGWCFQDYLNFFLNQTQGRARV
jgi:hypothetical protein